MLHQPPHLKAAFATDSLTCVDAELAHARHVVFYDIAPDEARFLDVLECDEHGSALSGLAGSGVLFTTGLTEREALIVGKAATFAVVLERRRAIHDVIARLQVLMRRDPPLWMCRVLHYGDLPPSLLSGETAAHDHF